MLFFFELKLLYHYNKKYTSYMLKKKTLEKNLLTVEDDNVNLVPVTKLQLQLENYLNYVESIQ